MLPDGWRRRISESGWDYLTENHEPEAVAEIMTRLYELGFRGPEHAPQINPQGTTVLWASPNTDGIPVLTSEGLLSFYKERGHRYFILRVPQLLRGCSGPNAARLQEVFANYEEQCAADGVAPIAEGLDYSIFVGGENDTIDDAASLVSALSE